ncbi:MULTISPECIES: response regulator transcription factor [Autumnicola]|uniref:LuxR C-terminal-related transcriptional regulator n=2 Tax=Autumnicola TaxID=3160927 RepID=A0ABU3CZ62_9FLAO|nr:MULTISPECIES: LuxR C-terminal-related transcriptional regulator [unclassified Zunongwangia]MDT0651175.1 LuxR C-terminal-related transcriptional regulator [Zunongwangia sp. F297]MDT0675573.1 LuxR C-terminal-related transcriptional regulator [Zunongwangia sp. F117]
MILALIQNPKIKQLSLRRYIILGCLFVLYNLTGGFLPDHSFLKPLILQYIITYGVAIALCVYLIYYLYKDYDIIFLKRYFSIKNIGITLIVGFIILFLIPYLITGSLDSARILFTLPTSVLGFIFLGLFYRRISEIKNQNSFFSKRKKLSTTSIGCIVLLPILTVIGDYQWLTFTVMNLAFYTITALEIYRYIYLIKNQGKLYKVLNFNEESDQNLVKNKIIFQNLTRREFEIALFILSKSSYKKIAKQLFIAENTVSKHASNIFRKTGTNNRKEFLDRFLKN